MREKERWIGGMETEEERVPSKTRKKVGNGVSTYAVAKKCGDLYRVSEGEDK